MKLLQVLLILISTNFLCFAQDVIYKLNSSDSIVAKVIEVNPETIKFKKLSNIDGPLYTIKKSEINKIIYGNGDIENYVKNSNVELDSYATIYVIRPKSKSGWINGMKIYEGEKIIGILNANTYLKWQVKAEDGEILITSKGEGSDMLRINPKKDNTYYIVQEHKTGWVKARPKIEFINENDAKKLLEKATPAESKYAE